MIRQVPLLAQFAYQFSYPQEAQLLQQRHAEQSQNVAYCLLAF